MGGARCTGLMLLGVVGACGSSPILAEHLERTIVRSSASSASPACDPTLPAAACRVAADVHRCEPGEPDAGEWRYALIAPLYAAINDVTRDELVAAWRGQPRALAMTAETRDVLAPLFGDGAVTILEPTERPELSPRAWAIVPADQLVPAWKVITVDGVHPLDPTPSALSIPLCASTATAQIANIDPDKVTRIAMTGTTALTRLVGLLMDRRGTTYPSRDVEPWLRSADFVHISQEVSLTPDCEPEEPSTSIRLCGRDKYIELLEASHANIIELTGSHLADFGRGWIAHTIEMYEERGWVVFGGGRTQREATAPRMIEHHGNQIAFLGCNMVWTTSKYVREGPGAAACDLARIAWEVGDLRRRGIVPIVSIQHEEVYTHDPPDLLVRDFRRLAEAGAAIVFGSQAHSAHPWEVHHGAFVHYGAGNFYFDQQFRLTRDAAHDMIYVHAGRVLTVGQLMTRLEEFGRPRPMVQDERRLFLSQLATSLEKLPPASPWAAPRDVDVRRRPDSFLVGKELQRVMVIAPVVVDPDVRYSLVLDLAGNVVDDQAFVVRVPGVRRRGAIERAAIAYLRAKYPIDPRRISVRMRPAR